MKFHFFCFEAYACLLFTWKMKMKSNSLTQEKVLIKRKEFVSNFEGWKSENREIFCTKKNNSPVAFHNKVDEEWRIGKYPQGAISETMKSTKQEECYQKLKFNKFVYCSRNLGRERLAGPKPLTLFAISWEIS